MSPRISSLRDARYQNGVAKAPSGRAMLGGSDVRSGLARGSVGEKGPIRKGGAALVCGKSEKTHTHTHGERERETTYTHVDAQDHLTPQKYLLPTFVRL